MMFADREEEELSASLSYPYWYGQPVKILPWWFRASNKAQEWKMNWYLMAHLYTRVSATGGPGRGWFTSTFPVFGPYYPMPSAELWQNQFPEAYYSSFWWP
ncbi:hypothetical protein [Alicyclobacillus sp. SO9]|uniref:hypothetical protein n=1 Tax=Alicyclobacillus sp. SO9 TaxID=2665646 RepID=UPI0018E8C154|nr:hypothetical protein [Alicyclobacillus sp. SO9]QQE77052.1 hypothetical protein GI364_13810 [Alicyclobacillus sp. SO9]